MGFVPYTEAELGNMILQQGCSACLGLDHREVTLIKRLVCGKLIREWFWDQRPWKEMHGEGGEGSMILQRTSWIQPQERLRQPHRDGKLGWY